MRLRLHENCKYLFRFITKLVLCEVVSDGLLNFVLTCVKSRHCVINAYYTVHVHTLHHRRKRAGKKSGGGRIFCPRRISASRIFFRRIFGAINFFGGGGQIRQLGGLLTDTNIKEGLTFTGQVCQTLRSL